MTLVIVDGVKNENKINSQVRNYENLIFAYRDLTHELAKDIYFYWLDRLDKKFSIVNFDYKYFIDNLSFEKINNIILPFEELDRMTNLVKFFQKKFNFIIYDVNRDQKMLSMIPLSDHFHFYDTFDYPTELTAGTMYSILDNM